MDGNYNSKQTAPSAPQMYPQMQSYPMHMGGQQFAQQSYASMPPPPLSAYYADTGYGQPNPQQYSSPPMMNNSYPSVGQYPAPPPYTQRPMTAYNAQPVGYGMYHPSMGMPQPAVQQQPLQPQMPASSSFTFSTNGMQHVQFDAGARFKGRGAGSLTIPPPPPGYAPTAAQVAAMQGQPVVLDKKKSNFISGSKGGGFTFW